MYNAKKIKKLYHKTAKKFYKLHNYCNLYLKKQMALVHKVTHDLIIRDTVIEEVSMKHWTKKFSNIISMDPSVDLIKILYKSCAHNYGLSSDCVRKCTECKFQEPS